MERGYINCFLIPDERTYSEKKQKDRNVKTAATLCRISGMKEHDGWAATAAIVKRSYKSESE